MLSSYVRVLCTEGRVVCCSLHTAATHNYYTEAHPNVRHGFNNRNPKPEFRKYRKEKVIKITLPPNTQPKYEELTPQERRDNMRKKGILPPRKWQEVPMNISASGLIFEPYVPEEGDGKASFLAVTAKGKELGNRAMQGGKTYRAIKAIKKFDVNFKKSEFAASAQDIYIKAHELLADRNSVELHKYASEFVFPLMMRNVKNKTIRWKFIKSVEFPRIVHARTESMIGKDNKFAQVTVRHHTQQTLAVYDRFGRLEHGSEVVAKDVLEYVVYENHISNEYGTWRMHGKIQPDWVPPRDPVIKTFIKPVLQDIPDLPEQAIEKKKLDEGDDEDEKEKHLEPPKDSPKVVTA